MHIMVHHLRKICVGLSDRRQLCRTPLEMRINLVSGRCRGMRVALPNLPPSTSNFDGIGMCLATSPPKLALYPLLFTAMLCPCVTVENFESQSGS